MNKVETREEAIKRFCNEINNVKKIQSFCENYNPDREEINKVKKALNKFNLSGKNLNTGEDLPTESTAIMCAQINLALTLEMIYSIDDLACSTFDEVLSRSLSW
mgnify:CR=1 FL=1